MKKGIIANLFTIAALSLSVSGAYNSPSVKAEETDVFCKAEYNGFVPGDLNNDSYLTSADLGLMADLMLNSSDTSSANADINQNDNTDVFDMIRIKQQLFAQSDSEELRYFQPETAYAASDSTEAKHYSYIYKNKMFVCEMTADEQELINRLNDFREKYGMRKFACNYGNNNFLDAQCQRYPNNSDQLYRRAFENENDELIDEFDFGGFLYNQTTFVFTLSNANSIYQSLTTKYQGDILSPKFTEIAVGHYGSSWKLVLNRVSINENRHYDVIRGGN